MIAIWYQAYCLTVLNKLGDAIGVLSEAYDIRIHADINNLLRLILFLGDDRERQVLLFLHGVPEITSWGNRNWKMAGEAANLFVGVKSKEMDGPILAPMATLCHKPCKDYTRRLTYGQTQ